MSFGPQSDHDFLGKNQLKTALPNRLAKAHNGSNAVAVCVLESVCK